MTESSSSEDKISDILTSISKLLQSQQEMKQTLHEKFDTTAEKLDTVESVLKSRLENMEEELESARNDIDTLGYNVDVLEEENRRLTKEMDRQAERIDYLENQNRRQNLLFYNVPKKQGETRGDCEQAVQQVIKNILNITSDVIIENAHRVGSAIIVRLHSFTDKQLILKNAHKLKQYNDGRQDARQKIGIAEDFSQTVRKKRKGLAEMFKACRRDRKKVSLVYDKLITDDGVYTFNLNTEEIELVKKAKHHTMGTGDNGWWENQRGKRFDGHRGSRSSNGYGPDGWAKRQRLQAEDVDDGQQQTFDFDTLPPADGAVTPKVRDEGPVEFYRRKDDVQSEENSSPRGFGRGHSPPNTRSRNRGGTLQGARGRGRGSPRNPPDAKRN